MTLDRRFLAVSAFLCLAGAELSNPTDALAATTVKTIAALRALPRPTAPVEAQVTAYAVLGDGGGGRFRYDPKSCAPDNKGTVIAPLGTVPPCGRWIRWAVGNPSVAWFGARADDAVPDTDAIQAAVDALPRAGTLRFPSGTYRIQCDKGVRLKSFMKLDLTGATLTAPNVNGARWCRILEIQGRQNVQISGGTLVGSRTGTPGMGVGVFVIDSQDVVLENVWIRDFFTDGILLTGNTGCQRVAVRRCVVTNNRRTGLAVVHASDVNVEASTFNGSRGQQPQAGANCEPNPGEDVTRVRFSGCSFGGNAGVGLYVHRGLGKAVSSATIEKCVVTKNDSGIVLSGVSGAWISANRVEGHRAKGKSGIMVADDTRGATVTGNTLLDNFRGIVSSGATGVVIQRNTIVGTGPGSTAGLGNGSDGILCLSGPSGTLGDACVVNANTIRRSAGNGIVAWEVSRVRLLSNVVEDSGQRGIHLRASTSSELNGNTVSGSGQELPFKRYDAIELEQGSNLNKVLSNIVKRTFAAKTPIRVAPDCQGNQLTKNVVLP